MNSSSFSDAAASVSAISSTMVGRAAARARAAASSFSRQQRLYFLPLPQGQGSLRPTLAISATLPGRRRSLYRAMLVNATFHEQLLDFDQASAVRAAGCGLCDGVVNMTMACFTARVVRWSLPRES